MFRFSETAEKSGSLDHPALFERADAWSGLQTHRDGFAMKSALYAHETEFNTSGKSCRELAL
jgi:hypothetical protein